ncbi:MAG TPA: ABC transporter permease subunit [Bacteroidota bacterium]|nr:ABC transporter permease subunit [Bacteroidota bacterium]
MSLIRAYVRLRRSVSWVDPLVFLALAALLYSLVGVGKEWNGVLRPKVDIDLSPLALPKYTFFSLVRGFVAYGISLVFTIVYGYVAAYNRRAEKVMIPLLDILQSIPVLGFLPTLVLALVALFPTSNIGLELAAVIMIFTGQVWNMTFSFYNSLRAIPSELREAGSVYRLGWWRRFTQLELPYSAIGLIWNSMMSMAGGWFFLTINEAFVLGTRDFRLPGIGSYMSVAIANGNVPAMIYAIIAMTTMIVVVDQFFWRPIVAWAQKYKFEDTEASETEKSFVLDMLRESKLLKFARESVWNPMYASVSVSVTNGIVALEKREAISSVQASRLFKKISGWLVTAAMLAAVILGSWKMFGLFAEVAAAEWLTIFLRLLFTFIRVFVAVVVGTALMVPAGVAIGLNPKLSRILQPVAQVAASFPAPMLFPLVIMVLSGAGIGIEIGAVVLMLLGTQWYILFNVIAGAMGIPQDLREVANVSRLTKWQVWKRLILPGIFPSLVTGWVTATGGAWNASIVAEYVHFGDKTLIATGLGSTITDATDAANFGILAASVLVMAATVVTINKLFWKKLYRIAETQYSLNK